MHTSATSSMLVPPAGDAMKMGPPAPLQHTRRREEGKKENKKEKEKNRIYQGRCGKIRGKIAGR